MKITDNLQEIFTVVDENDNIIAYRTRYDCHHDPSLIHRAVGIIIYNDKREILLQKRSMTKDTSPGLWTLSASGHVDKGETYEQAAVREVKEELGIALPLTFLTKFLCKTQIETEFDAVFTATSNGPFIWNSKETLTVAFFTPKHIQSMEDMLTEFALATFKKIGLFV